MLFLYNKTWSQTLNFWQNPKAWNRRAKGPGLQRRQWWISRIPLFFHAQKYDFRFDTLEKFGTRFLGFRLVTKFNRAPTFFGTRSSIPFWFQFIHAFSLMETWGHLKEIWFPLRETWVHLREIWFPLKEAWIHLKETWFLLKETRSHLTVSAGSLPVPEPMAVASALVFLWKASIFGTSNFAMDSNPFFTFFQIRDFSRLKKKD